MSKPVITTNKKGEEKMRVYVKSRKMAWTSQVMHLTDFCVKTPEKDSSNKN